MKESLFPVIFVHGLPCESEAHPVRKKVYQSVWSAMEQNPDLTRPFAPDKILFFAPDHTFGPMHLRVNVEIKYFPLSERKKLKLIARAYLKAIKAGIEEAGYKINILQQIIYQPSIRDSVQLRFVGESPP